MLLRPEIYERYADTAPRGFRFAVKGSRFITHNKKLGDVATPLANFFASGVLRLEEKLGPLLWQLPRQASNIERVVAFLDTLPYDTEAASKLAHRHDERVSGRASLISYRRRRIRHALEVRNERLFDDGVVEACRDHDVPIVFSDSGGKWPYTEEPTARWTYIRLHGAPRVYASRYSDQRLDRWADRIRAWHEAREPADPDRITDREPPACRSRDVWVFFDNDAEGHAPHDARRLASRLGAGD